MFPEVPRAPQYLETMFEADTPKRSIKAISQSSKEGIILHFYFFCGNPHVLYAVHRIIFFYFLKCGKPQSFKMQRGAERFAF